MKKAPRKITVLILAGFLTGLPLISCSETGDSAPDTETAAPLMTSFLTTKPTAR